MRHSLRIKIALALILMVSGAMLLNLIVSSIFQEKYYVSGKTKELLDIYEMFDDTINAGGEISESTQIEILRECESKNITAVVLDAGFNTILYSGYSVVDDGLLNRIKSLLFDRDTEDGEVVEENDEYVIQKVYDDQTEAGYLEMFGTLEKGELFLLRTSLETIKQNVSMTNQFMAYVGVVVVIISLFFVMIITMSITRRITTLAKISEQMSNLDFNAKYTAGGNDEIALLGHNMNKLSETLESTISELKTANNALRTDIEKKTQIDEMRKEFLANVSHELKTPIAIIQGYAEGLKESVNDDADSRDFYCEVIMDEAVKMNRMVKKLLTLNQLEFGNENLEMTRFDVVAVIDQVLNKFNVMIEEKNVEINFDNKKTVNVWADEFEVEEVLNNYISNALNHIDYDRIISIGVKDCGDVVRIKVFNSGEHIPQADIGKIWDKFYKVDKARTREYGGSGIGLSIVKAIESSMGRECGVSNVDGGVEFWFELEKSAS